MKFFFLLTFILLTVQFAFSQGDFRKGYIIQNSGDSVPGFVDYRSDKSNSKICYFKSSNESKTISYFPGSIKAFGYFGDKRYETKTIRNSKGSFTPVFAGVLVKSAVSFYKYGRSFYVEKDTLIELSQKEATIIEAEQFRRVASYWKEDKRYVGLLNYLLSDCHLTANKIKFRERGLIALIRNYNKCKGNEIIDFSPDKKWTKLNYALFSGFDRSVISNWESTKFTPGISSFVGTSIDFSSPKIFDRTFFTVEAWYAKKFYQGYEEIIFNSNSTVRNDYLMNVTYFKIPIGFRYNFTNETQTPYIKIGIVRYFQTNTSLTIRSEYETPGVVLTDNKIITIDPKSPTGIWISAGFSKTLYGKYTGFAELRYEKTEGFIYNYPAANSTTTNLIFIAGLRF